MYKNFTITESEKEQILNQHKSYGYKKPMNENVELLPESEPKIYSITRNDIPYNFGPYTKSEAKREIDNMSKDDINGHYYIVHYNSAVDMLPANERMGMGRLDKNNKMYFSDDTPFSQGDLADY